MRRRFFVAALMCMLMYPVVSCADDKPIPVDKLPKAAQEFVKNYFPELTIIYAEKDKEVGGTKYGARLSDGTEVEFNKKGQWIKVDRRLEKVPAALIPQVIADFVKATFPQSGITMIEKERKGYEVELTNDLDLKFSKDGRLLEMDD